jgi:hypothetical protein
VRTVGNADTVLLYGPPVTLTINSGDGTFESVIIWHRRHNIPIIHINHWIYVHVSFDCGKRHPKFRVLPMIKW